MRLAEALSEVLTGVCRRRRPTGSGRRRRSGWSRSRATPIRRTAARRCCSRCCSTTRTGPTKRSRCSRSVPASDPLVRPGARRPGADPATTRRTSPRPMRCAQRHGAALRRGRSAISPGSATCYEAMKRHNRSRGRLWPGGRRLAPAAGARRPSCGRCSCCARTRSRKRSAGPRPSRRSSRRWRSRPTSRCCSTSWAMPSSSGARIWMLPEAMIRKASALVARRCVDHRFARLGAVQARQGRRCDRDPPAGGREGSRPGRNPGASRRCALFVRAPATKRGSPGTASLVTAEDEIAARVKAKLASGLTPANAAP